MVGLMIVERKYLYNALRQKITNIFSNNPIGIMFL